MKTRLFSFACTLYFGFTLSSLATTHYVDANGTNPTAPYLDWSTAATNIQDAVDASIDGDLVLVTNGVYATGGRPVNGFALTNRVAIDLAVTVQSVNGASVTTIVGNPVIGDGAVRCVYMTNGASLIGFTLANGATRDSSGVAPYEQYGGGIFCESSNIPVSDCVLATNSSQSNGGAIYQGTLNDCTLVGNTAIDSGYGGAAESSTLTNCALIGNNGFWGGGADNSSLTYCLLSENQSYVGGGAVNSLLNACIVESNSAAWGGGSDNSTVNNCVVAMNTADRGGGESDGVMNNCTIVSNSASTSGGGDYGGKLTNCILYYNSGPAGSSNYAASQLNFCCTTPLPSSGTNIISAPLFVNLSGGDYHLQSNSPCINVGNNAYVVGNIDADGNPRIVAGTVDIGAYEYQTPVPLAVAIEAGYTNVAPGIALPFQAVISYGSPSTISWDFGDGTSVTNETAVSHSWTAPGNYLVTVTVSNAFTPGGATASLAIQVFFNLQSYVNVNNANPVPPYSSWDTAATNIQDAVEMTAFGGLVLVTNGVYDVGGHTASGFALSNRVVVDHPLTLQSVNGPSVTTIQGYTPATTNGPSAIRCVFLTNNASLIGFTISGGATLASGDTTNELSGGGILCASDNVVVSNCIVVSNACQNSGGGVYQGTLLGCTLTNNLSENGGGGASACILSNCVVAGNLAFTGGGGANGGTLYNCTISGNAARYPTIFVITDGGGIQSGTAINCLITGNSASEGGGVYSGTVINSAVWNNTAADGGGIYQGNATNSTIIGNTATAPFGGGGGLYFGSAANCIIYFNSSKTASSNYSASSLSYCCTFPSPGGTGNITNDPALASVTHISLNSPCRGAGNPAVTTGVDIDGEPWANPPSIGCDELYPGTLTNTPVITITAPFTNTPVGYSNTFTAAISGQVDESIWDFGDGTRVTNTPIVSHTWSSLGTYPVTLYAFNDAYPSGLPGVLAINYYIPSTLYVMTNSTTPVLPFDSWAKASTNIQNAIDVAYTNDVILVSNGLYNTGSRTNIDGSTNRIFVWQPVTVQSLNGSAVTHIDGGGTMRCVFLTNGANLIGFTITNGSSAAGSGIFSTSSNNLVANSLIISNRTLAYGGGIHSVTATNCTFIRNSGTAALLSVLQNCVVGPANSGSPSAIQSCLVSNCLVASNVCTYSAINSSSVYNSLIVSNAGGSGAGAYNSVLVNCIISSNLSSGAGVLVSCDATNCLITGNISLGDDGAGAASSKLVNCTVVSNSASSHLLSAVWTSWASNCIIYYNTVSGTNTPLNNGYSESVNNCCTYPLPAVGFGNFTNPPLFVNLAGGDYHLQSTSPCINAGNNTVVSTTTDLDGNPRIVGGTVDVGAYEYQTPTSILSYAWAQQYGIPTDGSADFADPDHDGMNNWEEWIAGTDPTDASSSLQLLSPSLTNSAGVTVTWQSVTNQTYYLQRASDLSVSPAFSTIQSNIVGQTGFTSFLDTTATNSDAYFYRVGIQQPYSNPFN